MTTRLERNIERIARNLNVEFEVVKEGHTGGQWVIKAFYSERAYCMPYERNNLARDIRKLGYKDERGIWWLPDDYMVVFGAGYGGCQGAYAKQWQYAIVKAVKESSRLCVQ